MKKSAIFLIVAFAASAFNVTLRAQPPVIQASSVQAAAAVRPIATEGQKVWVLINHIKADKRQQFEQFVHEIFWPMAARLSPEEQRVFRQTRVLHPTKAEADGTYSYLFIMDPLIEGADYGIGSLLKKMYGNEKGLAYSKMLEETFAREQTQYLVIQSKD